MEDKKVNLEDLKKEEVKVTGEEKVGVGTKILRGIGAVVKVTWKIGVGIVIGALGKAAFDHFFNGEDEESSENSDDKPEDLAA